jgi:hypothetical protein
MIGGSLSQKAPRGVSKCSLHNEPYLQDHTSSRYGESLSQRFRLMGGLENTARRSLFDVQDENHTAPTPSKFNTSIFDPFMTLLLTVVHCISDDNNNEGCRGLAESTER